MKDKIEKLYLEAIAKCSTPNTFSKKVLSLFGLNTEGSLSLPFDAIIHPHYDNKSRIDGGIIIKNGVVIGHADPIGEQGEQGQKGERNFLTQLVDMIILDELKKKLDKLNPTSDDDQSNKANTISFNGFEIRKFLTGKFGIQRLSKLDAGAQMDVVNNFDEVEKWLNTEMKIK